MQVSVFASGSSGNCLLVRSSGANVLLDAGISTRRIGSALTQMGLNWQDIDGVLITHEHSDHICGLKTLLKYYHIPLYAPHTVAARVCGQLPDAVDCMHVIPVGRPCSVRNLRVSAFHTPHDTQESVGYRVEGEGVFALATDMGCVTEEVLVGLSGADTALIEANHDEELLLSGPYPLQLKRRILSDHGHLSNTACAALARLLADSGTRRIILGHLSKENNRPALALRTVQTVLAGTGAEVVCAPPDGLLTVPVDGRAPCLL